MVLNNTNKNDSILLEDLASVFTVSSSFPDNPRITPVEILSKKPGDLKNDMQKRRLSAEPNWIKRLQTPYPLGLNDQIYQQGNISSVRCSHINVFSLKPDVRKKRRSHGVRRNGLSRRKKD